MGANVVVEVGECGRMWSNEELHALVPQKKQNK
jgi:hypothetical protein